MNDGSIPSVGNVWLRGLWKWFGIGSRVDGYGSHELALSGAKENGVDGLVGPPENEPGPAASVKILDSEVVL